MALPQDAARAGQAATDAKDSGADEANIDAQGAHHLGVLRGADQEAEPGPLQKLPDRQRDDDPSAAQERDGR